MHESDEMYGLIHRQIFRPIDLSRRSMSRACGKASASHWKSHQCRSFIQKQSKWKTLSGMPRLAMPSTNSLTVCSSYWVVNEVLSQSPNDHAGGTAGRPARRVYLSSTSFGSGPKKT